MSMLSHRPVTALPRDIIITKSLLQRVEREPKLRAEVAAFCELSRILTEDAPHAVRRFLEIARLLCDAGTAGLSQLRSESGVPTRFEWAAVSGALAALEGRGMSLDSSPCALCLDAGATILVARPERAYDELRAVTPAIVESLLVPLYDTARRPLGVLWLAHHDAAPQFCVNDVRVLEQLAVQLVLALKLEKEAHEHSSALALLDSHHATDLELANERDRRQRAEAGENSVRQALALKDVVLMEADHRVKNTLQIAAAGLSMQARTTTLPTVRSALQEAGSRLQLLAKVHEMLYRGPDARRVAMEPLLRTIGDALRASFAQALPDVVLRIACDPIVLAADDAVPMALLANEAMTNAYKYAFPERGTGAISVSFTHDTDNGMVLEIADDGVGMQANDDDIGLGLKLIRIFATQLNGVLSIGKSRAGTGTTLALTVQRPKDREVAQSTNAQIAARTAQSVAARRSER